jgi:hypothetical protein
VPATPGRGDCGTLRALRAPLRCVGATSMRLDISDKGGRNGIVCLYTPPAPRNVGSPDDALNPAPQTARMRLELSR